MAVSYITFEVELQDSVPTMVQAVEATLQAQLRTRGVVLGWCAIDADAQQQTLTVMCAIQY